MLMNDEFRLAGVATGLHHDRTIMTLVNLVINFVPKTSSTLYISPSLITISTQSVYDDSLPKANEAFVNRQCKIVDQGRRKLVQTVIYHNFRNGASEEEKVEKVYEKA